MTADPPGPLRRDEALDMWRAYTESRTRPVPAGDEPPVVDRFGDSAALAGEPLPRIGGHWVACDGTGRPRCVLRTVELRLGPLASVDDAFAADEGEGDRTRASWLAGHERYFRRTQAVRGGDWSDGLEVVFERFRVVWPPEVADPASTD
ncbi:ASCH domain-containing protein [Geodermatophilus sp. SYSU D00703]